MSKTPNYDAKVKAILDATKSGERVCALTGEKWMMTEEEIGWYKKFNVPPHPWAPIVRLKQMMGFPSGIAMWKKPHAETQKVILTFVHPDSSFKVISDREWFNSEFAQTERELDSSKSFFEQFKSLSLSIPIGALRDDGSNINCAGIDLIKAQDCYMVFGGYGNKRCMYGAVAHKCEDSCLMTNTVSVSGSFMINACADIYGCRYCFQNGKIVNCTFSFACNNLENCYGTCNRSYKKYLFWNEQLSQGEWEKRVGEIDLKSQKVWDEQVARFHKMVTEEAYWPPCFEKTPNEDCTGDYLCTCVRCHDCYWVDSNTDTYRCWVGGFARDTGYSVWAGEGDLGWMSVDLMHFHNVKFSMRTWHCQNLEYCMDCYDCENCFGCVGLRKKKFHIYNKPYAEEEYWRRLDEIKCAMLDGSTLLTTGRGEYGKFFPAELSQPGYQFSMGEFFLGYTSEELRLFGAPMFDPTVGKVSASSDIIKASELPDHLDDVDPEKYIGKPIFDEKLGRMYVITSAEFGFYKKHGVPIPREHFLTRMTDLFHHSNGPIQEFVKCVKCGIDVTTHKNFLFSGRRRVMCRPCYLRYLEELE